MVELGSHPGSFEPRVCALGRNTIGILGENPTFDTAKQICSKNILILKDEL